VSRGRTGKQGFLMHVGQGFRHQQITRKQAGVTFREKMFMACRFGMYSLALT
jgi:hypothetical protein